MKKIILLCLAAVALASCGDKINPSGNVISVEREVGGFSKIMVAHGINATVTMGDETSLKITADDNVIPYIETFVMDGALNVRVRRHTSFRGNPTLRVSIVAVELSGCSASGGSSIKFVNQLTGPAIGVDLSGGSRYDGSIEAGEVNAHLSGGSVMETSGTASKLNLECSGGSIFGDFDFATDEVNANLSGGSRTTLTVNEKLTVNASGGSTFRYRGDPAETNRNTSGGSTIERAD